MTRYIYMKPYVQILYNFIPTFNSSCESLLFISNTDRHYNKSLLTLWVYESSLKDPIAGTEEYWVIFSEALNRCSSLV